MVITKEIIMKYPSSPIEPVVETLHGRVMTDNYRWLEDDNSEAVKKWSKAQNELVQTSLKADKTYPKYVDELTLQMAIDSESAPVVRDGRYFYSAIRADQDHPTAVYKDGLDGEVHVLIDPNELSEAAGEPVGLSFWTVSPSGKYLSYGLIVAGREMSDLVVVELETMNEVLVLPYHRSAGVWLQDESGFYHNQYPMPGTVPKGEEYYHSKLYMKLLNSSDGPGELIFGRDMHKEMTYGCSLSPNNEWMVVSATRGWKRNDLYIARVGEYEFTPLIVGVEAMSSVILFNDRILLRTDYKAERKRILVASYDELPGFIDDWETFIPEAEDLLVGISRTKAYLVLEYFHNVASRLYLYSHQGEFVREFDIPALSSIGRITTNRDEEEFFYSFSNFLVSQTICRFNPVSGASEIYREPHRSLDAEVYTATQDWYVSTDGIKVPMFIIRRKDLTYDGSNKTLMYGYGGFSSSMEPGFPSLLKKFIESGGVYVVTNLRGGGEFGKPWHESGVRKRKQQTFDDFIAAAEYLIEKRITSPRRLAIQGGSNGGLLVAACMAQRPELFGAVICGVPLIDMVRFPLFLMASRWTEEYGDPVMAEDFEQILKWSPYHTIKSEAAYPAILITTGVNDSRVAPLHARKFAALMQSTAGDKPTYLWTDMAKGHGPGQGRSQFAKSWAMNLVFLDRAIGKQ